MTGKPSRTFASGPEAVASTLSSPSLPSLLSFRPLVQPVEDAREPCKAIALSAGSLLRSSVWGFKSRMMGERNEHSRNFRTHVS